MTKRTKTLTSVLLALILTLSLTTPSYASAIFRNAGYWTHVPSKNIVFNED